MNDKIVSLFLFMMFANNGIRTIQDMHGISEFDMYSKVINIDYNLYIKRKAYIKIKTLT